MQSRVRAFMISVHPRKGQLWIWNMQHIEKCLIMRANNDSSTGGPEKAQILLSSLSREKMKEKGSLRGFFFINLYQKFLLQILEQFGYKSYSQTPATHCQKESPAHTMNVDINTCPHLLLRDSHQTASTEILFSWPYTYLDACSRTPFSVTSLWRPKS